MNNRWSDSTKLAASNLGPSIPLLLGMYRRNCVEFDAIFAWELQHFDPKHWCEPGFTYAAEPSTTVAHRASAPPQWPPGGFAQPARPSMLPLARRGYAAAFRSGVSRCLARAVGTLPQRKRRHLRNPGRACCLLLQELGSRAASLCWLIGNCRLDAPRNCKSVKVGARDLNCPVFLEEGT